MRTPSEVVEERRRALLQFSEARGLPVEVEAGHGAAREVRREQERREAVREREQESLRARVSAQDGEVGPGPRAVVVHRAAWVREALCRELEQTGVRVVSRHDDGAAGLGAVVAEQPDLVVVQEQLPWKDGLELVREVRRFAPSARVAVHLDRPAAEQAASDAGADVVFARATRPGDMVRGLVGLVAAGSSAPRP